MNILRKTYSFLIFFCLAFFIFSACPVFAQEPEDINRTRENPALSYQKHTVGLDLTLKDGRTTIGTAIAMRKHLALTCNHIVDIVSAIKYKGKDVKIVYQNKSLDLALLEIPDFNLDPVQSFEAYPMRATKLGVFVYCGDGAYFYYEYIVSYQANTALAFYPGPLLGTSGGGLFTPDGRFAGLVQAVINGAGGGGLGLSAPVNVIHRFLMAYDLDIPSRP